MITNGWAYVLLGFGAYLNIDWMTAISGIYLAFLWLPFTPEKLITIPIAIALLRFLFPNDKKTLGLCLINGDFLALHFATYFESLKHTSVASAVVLVDTQVIFVALIMWLVMKQKIPVKGIIGIVLTLG